MFEIIVLAVGIGIGSLVTHIGYKDTITLLKTDLLIVETKLKSYLNKI